MPPFAVVSTYSSPGDSTGTARRFRRAAASGAIDHEAVVAYLRRRFPLRTAAEVADATGVSAGTVENWLLGKSGIGGVAFARCAFYLGPEFLAAAWRQAPEWLSAAHRAMQIAELDAEIASLAERRREIAGG